LSVTQYWEEIFQKIGQGIITDFHIEENKIISFDIIREDNGFWIESQLKISNLENLYFKKFETGMERKGMRNLLRLELNKDKGKVEWIYKISLWDDQTRNEIGFEIQLYSGKIFKFITTKPEIAIYDIKAVTHDFIKPEKTISKIKILQNDKLEITKPSTDQQRTQIIAVEKQKNNESQVVKSEESNLVNIEETVNNYVENIKFVKKEKIRSKFTKKRKLKSLKSKSEIDRIKTIYKPVRQKLTVSGFETIEKLSQAKLRDLTSIDGIGKATAKKIMASVRAYLKTQK